MLIHFPTSTSAPFFLGLVIFALALPALSRTDTSTNDVEASQLWDHVVDSVPQAADVRVYCQSISRVSPGTCARQFLSGDPMQSYVARQAAANCVARLQPIGDELQRINAMFKVDPLDIAAHGGLFSNAPPGFSANNYHPDLNYHTDANGVTSRKDYSPADRAAAGAYALKSAKEGAAVASGASLGAIGTVLGPLGNGVLKAAGSLGGLAGVGMAPSAADNLQEILKATQKNAEAHPERTGREPTGTCVRGQSFCTAADGQKYPNSDVQGGGDQDSSKTSSKNSEPTQSSMGNTYTPSPSHTPGNPNNPADDLGLGPGYIISGVDWNRPTPGEAIVRPVSDPDDPTGPLTPLQRCIEEEERKLVKYVGNIRPVELGSGPATEEEKHQAAEEMLRQGLCDRSYYGETFCNDWKRKLETEPLDPEQQAELDLRLATFTGFCPIPAGISKTPSACASAKQQILKRYVVDQFGSNLVNSIFQSKVSFKPPVNIRTVPEFDAGQLKLVKPTRFIKPPSTAKTTSTSHPTISAIKPNFTPPIKTIPPLKPFPIPTFVLKPFSRLSSLAAKILDRATSIPADDTTLTPLPTPHPEL